ncbi:hypothetical protein MSG28_006168 [Choristoneura fumiferana]|uniref:Uncharacterized protein n=1 Tax=Choristoneura fumiferana TaxID=7141 RepID=A0ACC0JDS2_CHOFU|nr:hypothetical protein MSG28_006168 [Choristoneura fumiferana]
MWIAQCCFLLLNFIGLSTGLLCYNCSSTNRDWNHCSGDFGTASPFAFNSSRLFLINCTGARLLPGRQGGPPAAGAAHTHEGHGLQAREA